MLWKGTSHTPDLAQCRIARSNDVGDVGPHGDISVDVNTKVLNSTDPWHQNITDTNRCGRDQVLTSRWGAPEDLGLGEIQLQSICLQASSTLKSRRCRLRPAEQDRQRWTADSVHRSECRLHTRVAWDDDVWRAATGRQCTGETRSVQGPNLAGLQSRLPMASTIAVRTCCVRPLRYDVPVDDLLTKAYDVRNRWRNMRWSTQSNAADRSSRVSITKFPESSADKMSDRTLRMAVSVEWCALYADWMWGSRSLSLEYLRSCLLTSRSSSLEMTDRLDTGLNDRYLYGLRVRYKY